LRNLPEATNFRQHNLAPYASRGPSKTNTTLRGHCRRIQHLSFCVLVHLVPYTASSIPKDVTDGAKPFGFFKPMKTLMLNHPF